MLLRFQEKAVSSQIYCILKQNVKHMENHVLLEVRISRVKERTFVSDLNLIS